MDAETARTVEDVFARRVHLLFVGAKAGVVAADVAHCMPVCFGKDAAWIDQQSTFSRTLAKQCFPILGFGLLGVSFNRLANVFGV